MKKDPEIELKSFILETEENLKRGDDVTELVRKMDLALLESFDAELTQEDDEPEVNQEEQMTVFDVVEDDVEEEDEGLIDFSAALQEAELDSEREEVAEGDHSYKYVEIEVQRGFQGGRATYSTNLNIKHFVEWFDFDDEEISPEFRYQRKVQHTRAKKIGKYVMDNPYTYVLPAVTVEVQGVPITPSKNEPIEFIPHKEGSNQGVIRIPLGNGVKHRIVDGQHRRYGLQWLLEEEPEQFEGETIPMTIQEFRRLELSQQKFADINSTGKNVSGSITHTFNHRSKFSVLCNDILKECTWLARKLDKEANQLAPTSSQVMTSKQFAQFITMLTGGLNDTKLDKMSEEKCHEWKAAIIVVLEKLKSNLPEWENIFKGIVPAADARKNYVVTQQGFLLGLARILSMTDELILKGRGVDVDGFKYFDYESLQSLPYGITEECWNVRLTIGGYAKQTAPQQYLIAAFLAELAGLNLKDLEVCTNTKTEEKILSNIIKQNEDFKTSKGI
ncbi:DNA sulfur modification protein DndB [Vibrio panuliri]|uniref:DGQHR domain-containing protein n=1 Tax=Vibrio panuliri TaxID=1381081 RepID=A0ABX3FIS7_9VIBR|nr:DNA sulfur modification protein DndB [Vibrio panuliri]OLQ91663.1 hypothetical protein BIY20_09680 [Vibrio panuliri]